MIIIDRNSDISEKREIIRCNIVPNPQIYNVVTDVRNGRIVLIERPTASYYIKIGKLNLGSVKCTRNNVNQLASILNGYVRAYNRQSLMCKSRVIPEYGKIGLLDVAYVKTVDNPHYKCAGDMKLYDKNVIEYNLEKYENKHRRIHLD